MASPAPDVEEFVTQHWGLALWVAHRRTAMSGGRGDPADIESDALYGLYRAATRWRPDGGTSTASWARLHIEGAITDGLRARHGDKRSPRSAVRHVGWDDAAGLRAHHDDLGAIDDRAAVAAALGCLDAREQAAVKAHYWNGWTLAKIGADLGVTESRACQILTRARARLRRALEQLDLAPHHRIARWWGAVVRWCGAQLAEGHHPSPTWPYAEITRTASCAKSHGGNHANP